MVLEPGEAEARVRRAYEGARASRALVWTAPLALFGALAVALSARPTVALALSAALVVMGAVALWRGKSLERAVVPGVAAGVVPFALAHAAHAYGHVCTGSACYSVCMPACGVGGVVAGLFVWRVARRRSATRPSWIAAGLFASLVGALGCSCAGNHGVMALVAGLCATLLVPVLRGDFRGHGHAAGGSR